MSPGRSSQAEEHSRLSGWPGAFWRPYKNEKVSSSMPAAANMPIFAGVSCPSVLQGDDLKLFLGCFQEATSGRGRNTCRNVWFVFVMKNESGFVPCELPFYSLLKLLLFHVLLKTSCVAGAARTVS